jgi:hypothetical protein
VSSTDPSAGEHGEHILVFIAPPPRPRHESLLERAAYPDPSDFLSDDGPHATYADPWYRTPGTGKLVNLNEPLGWGS